MQPKKIKIGKLFGYRYIIISLKHLAFTIVKMDRYRAYIKIGGESSKFKRLT